MLQILKSSIFESPAQTLVNTVNTVGAMGKGVALGFKTRYPAMYKEYKQLCDQRELTIGSLHCWRSPGRLVLNFPTKTTWKRPSKIEYVEAGLNTFVRAYKKFGITSASFPPLGCGNGQLSWDEVRPLMLHYLWNLDIPIFIHDWHNHGQIEPEHKSASARVAPFTYSEFMEDLRAIMLENKGRFRTMSGEAFCAQFNNNLVEIFVNDRLVIPEDLLIDAWVALRMNVLTAQGFGAELYEYLIPIVKELPYVLMVPTEHPQTRERDWGLFFNERSTEIQKFSVKKAQQECLFP